MWVRRQPPRTCPYLHLQQESRASAPLDPQELPRYWQHADNADTMQTQCTHMPTHAHACTHMHTMHSCTSVQTHEHTHAHTCTHMPTHAHPYPNMHTHAHTCTYMHTHIKSRRTKHPSIDRTKASRQHLTHIYTHTRTHTHTQR